MTSKQAKEILAKIDDESAKAEFIASVIVRIASFHFALDSEWLSFIFSWLIDQDKIVDKDDFVPEIDRLPKNIAKKLRIDLKDILAFNPSNASGRYAFDMQLFADRIILQKLMVSFSMMVLFRL